MDILNQAMKIEKEGEVLYRRFAQEASDEGAVYIFSWLADQEKKHYDVFKKMADSMPAFFEQDISFQAVRDIFSAWKESRIRLDVSTFQVELYRKAFHLERKSVELYEEAAKTASDEKAGALFREIADEERLHQIVMENIIEFVTKPEIWAENAEFGYRGAEYYI